MYKSSNKQLRSFAIVLLRRIAFKSSIISGRVGSERAAWDIIRPEARANIQSSLLQAFTYEQTKDVRHKLSDAISELARNINESDGKIYLFISIEKENIMSLLFSGRNTNVLFFLKKIR